MILWIWLQLLLFGRLVCLPDKEDVTQGVTISFVTEYIHFIQPDMPDMVQLNMTTEGEVTHVVTLFKRPEQFQNVPVYVPNSAGRTQWTQAHTTADPLLDTQELTWYTTRPSTALHLAACLVRVHQGDSRVSVHLKDDGFLVLGGAAYSLKYIPPVKRNSGGLGERYLLTKRGQHPSTLHRTRSSPDGVNRGTRGLGCTNVYLDICVHADFDLYEKRGKSLSKVRTHIKDIMNEVQVLYNMLPSGRNSFAFRVHMELANIFVETSIFTDPIKLRQTPMTQAVIDGEVYQNVFKAHDLLTAWLRDKYPAQCDHYSLFTGTYPAEFYTKGEKAMVYTTSSLALAWDGGLCQEDLGKRSSVVYDITADTAILIAHEIGHNVGLSHLQPSGQCPGGSGQAMMAPVLQHNARETVHWNPCTVSSLQRDLYTCLSTTPELLTIGKAKLDAACRFRYGPDATYNWDGREVNQSSVCKRLECQDNRDGTVHTINTPYDIPCGPKKGCDGHGACIFTTAAEECNA